MATVYGNNILHRKANVTTLTVDVANVATLNATGNVSGAFTGTFVANASTAATTPSYTFVGETNTGLYKPSANQLGVTVAGSAVGTFSSSGLSVVGRTTVADGTLAAPAFGFTNETGSGYYRAAAGNVGLVVNGAGVLWASSAGVTIPNQAIHGAGTLAAPSMTFIGETNTGFYKSAANQVSLSVAGTSAATFGASSLTVAGNVLTGSGTAALPALAFTGEAGTGVYKAAAGNVGVSAQGTASMFATSTGVTVPGTVFHSSGALATPSFAFIGETNTGVYKPAAGNVAVVAQGTASMYATSTGVTVPGSVFHAAGTLAAPSVTFVGETGTGVYKAAAGNVALVAQGTASMFATSTGVTVPGNVKAERLMVSDGTASGPSISFDTQTNTGFSKSPNDGIAVSVAGLSWFVFNDGGIFNTFYIEAVDISASGTVDSGTFKASDGSEAFPAYTFFNDPSSGMYKDSGGNVAISVAGTHRLAVSGAGLAVAGTVSASSNLQVGGDATITGNLTVQGTTTTLNTDQMTVEDPILVLNSGGINQQTGIFMRQATGANVCIAYQNNKIELFNTLSPSSATTLATSSYADVRANSFTLSASGSPTLRFSTSTETGFYGSEVAGVITTVGVKAGGSTVAKFNSIDNVVDGVVLQVLGPMRAERFGLLGPATFNANGVSQYIMPSVGFSSLPVIYWDDIFVYYDNKQFMGTLSIAVTNYFPDTPKVGYATASVLWTRSSTGTYLELDVVPIMIHKNSGLTTFSLGKRSTNDAIVIDVDAGCKVAWQISGSVY